MENETENHLMANSSYFGWHLDWLEKDYWTIFFWPNKSNPWRPYFDNKSAKRRSDEFASGLIRKREVRWTNPYMEHLKEINILTDFLMNKSELESNFIVIWDPL